MHARTHSFVQTFGALSSGNVCEHECGNGIDRDECVRCADAGSKGWSMKARDGWAVRWTGYILPWKQFNGVEKKKSQLVWPAYDYGDEDLLTGLSIHLYMSSHMSTYSSRHMSMCMSIHMSSELGLLFLAACRRFVARPGRNSGVNSEPEATS